jgi:D-alanine-D-alanine ligase
MTFNLRSEMGRILWNRGITLQDDALEEYDQPETLAAIEKVLMAQGHDVKRLGNGWGESLLTELGKWGGQLDLVFNIAEGYGGRSREAQVPAVLEMLSIPFVGSDAMALAVSLDKQATKSLVRAAGVTIPKGFLVRKPATVSELFLLRRNIGLEYPLIVKPAYEGSSKGIRQSSLINTTDEDLRAKVDEVIHDYNQPALVEEFIWGREVTVGIVGDPPEVLGIMEIAHKSRDPYAIYSLEVKRNWKEEVVYTCPPSRLDSLVEDQLRSQALAAFEALGCRDFARVDFRLRGTNSQPVFLEINPLPGLNPASDLPLMAEAQKISYDTLIGRIIAGAIRRNEPSVHERIRLATNAAR